jgi:hypothetical protein
MKQKEKLKKPPDTERLEAFKNLPTEILRTLTKEEVTAFLYDEEWPDSLAEKLKDYMVAVSRER